MRLQEGYSRYSKMFSWSRCLSCCGAVYVIHMEIRTCIHTYRHSFIHTYIHTYMNYIHCIYMHAYVRTCMHGGGRGGSCEAWRAVGRRGHGPLGVGRRGGHGCLLLSQQRRRHRRERQRRWHWVVEPGRQLQGDCDGRDLHARSGLRAVPTLVRLRTALRVFDVVGAFGFKPSPGRYGCISTCASCVAGAMLSICLATWSQRTWQER